MKAIKIRNKNAILELLKDGADFEKIILASDLKQDDLTKEILSIATNLNALIKKIADILARKTTGIITIVLQDGGIRKVKLEKDITDSE